MGEVNLKVELIKYTENPESVVALAAKLCYSDSDIIGLKEGIDNKDISGFIKKLISLNHLSPIEHASFTFGVEGVSRALLAQITRHRIASFSVKSQRYVNAEKFNYVIPPEIKKLGKTEEEEFKRQMDIIHGFYKGWSDKLGKSEKGNEDARFVLPNACETKFLLTMNARELMHFFELRCCNRAQWEIRELAWKMLELVNKVAPNIFSMAGPSCGYKPCGEGKMTCGKSNEVKERLKLFLGDKC